MQVLQYVEKINRSFSNKCFSQGAGERLFLLCFALLFAIWLQYAHQIALLQTFVFFAALVIVYFLPGDLIRLVAGARQTSILCGFVESTGLGLAVFPIVYLIVRRCGCEVVMPYILAMVATMWLLVKWRRKDSEFAVDSSVSIKVIAGFLFLAIVVISMLQFSHYTDIIKGKDSVSYRNSFLTETVYHQGIINALKYDFPPRDIYGSGDNELSSYHIIMHLEIELLNRYFDIDIENLVYYYFPTLYFILASLLSFILFLECYGAPIAGVLCGVLLYASDFTYIPGIFRVGVAKQLLYPWIYYYPAIWSLFTLNGLLPAVFVLVLSLIYLHRYFVASRWQDAVMYFSLVYAVTGLKTSMGLHLLGVSFFIGAYLLVVKKDFLPKSFFLLASLSTTFIVVLEIVVFRGGTGGVIVKLSPFNQFDSVAFKLGLTGIGFWMFPLAYVAYLLIVFGVRISVFWFLFRFFKKDINVFILFLLAFVVSGFVLSEFVFLGHKGISTNNGSWFAAQSLIGAWILFCIQINEFFMSHAFRFKVFVAFIIFAISYPSTIEFLSKRYSNKYYHYNSFALDIVDYFNGVNNTSIIINPITMVGPSIAANLSGRSTYLSMYMSFIKNEKLLKSKIDNVNSFFSPFTTVNKKRSLIKSAGINYVYATSEYSKMLTALPFLRLAHSNDQYVVYKVGIKD